MTRTSRGLALFLIITGILFLCIPSALGADECPCQQDPCSCDDINWIPADCNCPFDWNENDISPACACPFGWNETDVNPECVCPFSGNVSDYSICCSCPFGPSCGSGRTGFHAELNADFSANVTSGPTPLTVKFSQFSTGDPTTWEWDFGDGQASSSSSPVHTYTAPGSYTVTLMVSRGYSSGQNTQMVEKRTISKPGYIQVTGYASVQSPDHSAAEQKNSGAVVFQMMKKMEQEAMTDIADNPQTRVIQLHVATIKPASGIPGSVISGESPAGTLNRAVQLNELLAMSKVSKKSVSFP